MLIAGILCCVLVGVPMILIALSVFARDRKIKQWPRATAVIIGSGASTTTRRSDEPNASPHTYVTWYSPYVRYTYTVGDKTFEGSSIARSIDGVDTDQTGADRIVKKYPEGARVEAYYNPADPSKAHLEVRVSIGAIILLAMGIVSTALGALLATLSLVTSS